MKVSRRSWLFLTLAVLCGMASASGQITPLADSYTNTAAATTNYGAALTINVDGATEAAFIQFNLVSIPANTAVSKATLKLYVNTVTTAGSFNVDYVNSAWAESTIKANNAPPLGGNIASNVTLTLASKNQFILVDVTAAVQAWLGGGETNNGIALVANNTFNATFDSKENTTTSHAPELDIVYAGGINGVTTSSSSGLTGGGTSGTLALGLTTSCASNQVLQWSGSAWACASVGTGTITSVLAGTALTGGGSSGAVTLNLDTTQVPLLGAANVFNNSQVVNGNLSATGVVTGSAFQIGSNLFDYGSFANQNAFTGFAGNTAMTGGGNTASGVQALAANTTGTYNTAAGLFALFGNTTGSRNTASGESTLGANTSGSDNAANGFQALAANTTGIGNTASGSAALTSNTTGGGNSGLGYAALQGLTTGNNDTAVGSDAMNLAVTGNNNTGMGAFAGKTLDNSALSGGSNTLLGVQAWLSTGTLNNATAIGANAEVAQSNSLVLGSISGVNGAAASTNVGIGTTTPAYTLDVHGTGNFTGLVTFSSGQTFPGTGTITSLTAGSGLSGGGSSGGVTLTNTGLLGLTAGTGITAGTGQNPSVGINTSVVPQLAAANTFTGNQTVNGNLSATGVVTGSAFQIGSNLFDFGSYINGNAFTGFSGNTSMIGGYNTATGVQALFSNTSGNENTASGVYALFQNTLGYGNTASGSQALNNNTTGGLNTGMGMNSGNPWDASYMTGSNNTFLGAAAVPSTGTLNNATAVGANAQVAESNALVLGSIHGVGNCTTACASVNVGIGTTTPAYTLDVHGTANFTGLVTFAAGQTFTGNETVNGNLSATGVVSGSGFQIGSALFDSGSFANNNAFTGFGGNTTMTGGSNTATGVVSLISNTTGNNNTATGAFSLQSSTTASNNTADGNSALRANTTGNNNTAVGIYALTANTTGGNNVAAGSALSGNASGNFNAAAGNAALGNNTTGSVNTGMGNYAGSTADNSAMTGSSNTFLGGYAYASTGTLNNATAIGALAEVAASNAIVLGGISGVNNCNSLNNCASVNVGIGTTTPAATLDVEGNAAATSAPIFWLKNNAGIQSGATGNSVDIRFSPDGGGAVAAPNAYIRAAENGSGLYATYMAFGTIVQGGSSAAERIRITSSGNVGIGTTVPDSLLSVNGTADKPGGGSWGTFSDRRLKDLDGSFNAGLSEILKINPVKYRYKNDNGMGIRDHDEHIGVVAQEIKQAIPEAVTENNKGYLMVNNDPVIWAMLNAIKEQQKEIASLRAQLKRRTAKEAALETRLSQLEKGKAKLTTHLASAQLPSVQRP